MKTSQPTADAREFMEFMVEKLPPVVARKDVERALGGVVAHQTLANADKAGTGPAVAYRVGRSVVYRSDSLVAWIVERFGVTRIANINSL